MNLTSNIRHDQTFSQSMFNTALDFFSEYMIPSKQSTVIHNSSIDIDFPRLERIKTQRDSSTTEIILFWGVSND